MLKKTSLKIYKEEITIVIIFSLSGCSDDVKQIESEIKRLSRTEEFNYTTFNFEFILNKWFFMVNNSFNKRKNQHFGGIYMKATGIVRRIDDLGRVVIPKEIRRTMRIREGDPLEIYTTNEGEVVLKKYSQIGELTNFASQYAEVLNKTSGIPALICDRDHVLAVSGVPKKEVLNQKVSSDLQEAMETRKIIGTTKDSAKVSPVDSMKIYALACTPIVSAGDVCGAVMYLSADKSSDVNETQIKLAEAAASFLSKQLS